MVPGLYEYCCIHVRSYDRARIDALLSAPPPGVEFEVLRSSEWPSIGGDYFAWPTNLELS